MSSAANTIERRSTPSITKLHLYHFENGKKVEHDLCDLRVDMLYLNIYNSIDDMVISGDVGINEKTNRITQMSLNGMELIEIQFNSSGEYKEYDDFHGVFFVYAIDNVQESAETRSIVIRFVDILGMLNNDLRISKNYKDKTIEDIIKNVNDVISNKCKDYFLLKNQIFGKESQLFIEYKAKTNYKPNFIVPLWKPLKLISYLTSHAVSTDSENLKEEKMFSDCVFFERANGTYVFTNYKKMFEEDYGATFEKTVPSVIRNDSSIEEVRYRIKSSKVSDIYNVQNQKLAGMMGFKDFTFNFCIKNNTDSPLKGIIQDESKLIKFSNLAKVELTAPLVLSASDVKEIVMQYAISNTSGLYQFPYKALNQTENSVIRFNIAGIQNKSTDEKYSEFKSFTIPYERALSIIPYIRYAQLTLEMNGISDMDIGKSVKLDFGSDTNSMKTIGSLLQTTKWVISSFSHRYLRNDEFTTVIKCFTPYFYRNYNATEKK